MRNSRAVVCGLARDVGAVLPQASAAIEQLGGAFAEYQVVVFENDSTDDTRQLLQDWSNRNSQITVLSEQLGDPVNRSVRCLRRATRMASYRNRYLNQLAENYRDYDVAVVIDMDLGGNWCEDGIAHTFGHNHWDFVGSYGTLQRHDGRQYVPVHYDAWAFRVVGDDRPLPTKIVNHLKPESGDQLMPVNSCFGGVGVYRMQALLAGWYSGEDCEHVTLHRRMRAAGYDRLFLNRRQTTHYGWRKASPWRVWRSMCDRFVTMGGIGLKQVA